MLKRVFLAVVVVLMGIRGYSQTDSSDLSLYRSTLMLATELDTMLYGSGGYDQLNLSFTVSDTLNFSKVHVALFEQNTGHLVFKKVYSLTELESSSLISAWDVQLPFGNLPSSEGYTVNIIIEDYTGALHATLTKTITP